MNKCFPRKNPNVIGDLGEHASLVSTNEVEKDGPVPGQSKAVFFDIGNVLASPVLSSDHTTLVGLSVYPFVPEVLDAVRKQQAQLGIISNTAPSDTTETMKAVLEKAGLLRRRRYGRVHEMELDAKPLKKAAQWVEEYRKFWEGSLDRLAAYLENTNKAAGKKGKA